MQSPGDDLVPADAGTGVSRPVGDEAEAVTSERFVQSLARGLAVIRAFGQDRQELSLSDVARRAEVSRASARRLLLTLEHLGYVRGNGRTFALTPLVLELGHSFLSGLGLPEVAQPHLERLSRALGESSSASVLDRGDIVYVARVPTRRIMTVGITLGTRFPAHATSMGRVLLAGLPPAELRRYLEETPLVAFTPRTVVDPAELERHLEEVRGQGWALVEGELEPGLRSVAAPVRNTRGETVAALNVSTQVAGTTGDSVRERHLPELLRACAEVGRELALVRPDAARVEFP
ncbi:IclR family pca regulon transcriptional regulator [Kineococcus xinjiangensis]|uniref:Glycerol operon regulatory protein n=1 Tax=Kineococcus xinjiangensis TaxID=512762 RepID=A0A2S6IPF9_9ACTN|nr:IclR family transcriptional regulator C-terminal domain-containing protein [Kineococcus xinjiangensis]PPK96020.1 IclR family pca regulon transcriptional regulator [Kineococcus xinjiangensis]